jgi:hypothetical protein
MTLNRDEMKEWVVIALQSLGGSGTIIDICKYIWKEHEETIRNSGDAFYTWQYEVRWAGSLLRKEGIIKSSGASERGVWELSNAP